ncbi:MAG: HlyD family efflux transporter periplasmic adaptor subunit [Proteobacteria bacterium]|nr:HlyD family efflux transporter periplasmic adaptor subunit [Pseudomonadota bacterium]
MQLVRASRQVALSGKLLLALLLLLGAAMLLLPWQQTSPGEGRIVAYAPSEREQLVGAPIGGRILKWWVHEGSRVRQGDRLVELADNDPLILERLQQERDATAARLAAREVAIGAYERQIVALRSARELELAAAEARVRVAQSKVKASVQAAAAAGAAATTAELNVQRVKSLADRGLASERDRELGVLAQAKTQTDSFAAQAKLEAERSEVLAKRAEVSGKGAELDAKIAKVSTELQSALAEVQKVRGELSQVEVRRARQAHMVVRATRDGSIMRVVAREGAEFVKAGDPLFLFVPDSARRAVEFWVDGNDAPLIRPGRLVRLQFEGWPAVQFSGWPSIAVGTFGGEVAFVDDAAGDGGRFRVVVVAGRERWPDGRYLRQGARANGWVLLDRVSVGYELWRRLNGFPPRVAPPAAEAKAGGKSG